MTEMTTQEYLTIQRARYRRAKRRQRGAIIDEVDITSDPQLFRRYDIRIPVMVIEGGEELNAPLTEEIVIRALRKTI